MHALVFIDDIGVRLWQVHRQACAGMEWCGAQLDLQANRQAPADQVVEVSRPGSPVMVLSVPKDEALVIAQGARLLEQGG